MKISVVSTPGDRAGETATVRALFDAGLSRFHLRKPDWDESRLARWLDALPETFHGRIVLHSHHGLARRFAVGGVHFRDTGTAPAVVDLPTGVWKSRACHDAAGLLAALGTFDAVLVAPVFPSLSKAGHGPLGDLELAQIKFVLAGRNGRSRETAVFALGGVTANRLPTCREFGFDGAAVLGAVWDAPDPVAAFREIHVVASTLSTPRKTP